MFLIVTGKLKNRFGKSISILAGITLFVSIFVLHPMFLNGASNQMLSSILQNKITEKNEYPTVLSRNGSVKIEQQEDFVQLQKQQEQYQRIWKKYLTVPVKQFQEYYQIKGEAASPCYEGAKKSYTLMCSDTLKDHIQIVCGSSLKNVQQEAYLPCLISTRTMDEDHLVMGETLQLQNLKNKEGQTVCVKVVGIYEEKDLTDCYWQDSTKDWKDTLVISPDAFAQLCQTKEVQFVLHGMLDHTKFYSKDSVKIKKMMDTFSAADTSFSWNFHTELKQFEKQKKSIQMLLTVLEIPVCLLLGCFLIMVSTISVKSEQIEIAMLISRGFSRWYIVRMYALQFAVLSFGGGGLGLLLGYGFGKLGAMATGFLTFEMKHTAAYCFTWQMLVFAVAAAALAVFLLSFPAFLYSRQTVVQHLHTDTREQEAPFWKKYFLDGLLLVVSLYLLYNYKNQQEQIAASAMLNEGLDPMIFVDNFLFLLGVGLLSLRLIHMLLQGMFHFFKERLSPAYFASFIQILRTQKKQSFFAIFLVVTIANGWMNANLARTINENGTQRVTHNVGCDARIATEWGISLVQKNNQVDWYYNEPDYEKLKEQLSPYAASMTRVIRDSHTTLSTTEGTVSDCELMGISTKEFGTTAQLKDGLNDRHWYYALNALSEKPNGIIISENLANAYGYKIGDSICFRRNSPISDKDLSGEVSGEVVAIVKAWPSVSGYQYAQDDAQETKSGNTKEKQVEKEQYLLVANYLFLVDAFQLTPYEVWIKYKQKSIDEKMIQKAFLTSGYLPKTMEIKSQAVENRVHSAIVQITNGMYSLSFLLSFAICILGFFLYWVQSVKSRGLAFGVCRAMGMTFREIFRMLFVEQFFSSVLAMVAGFVAGTLGSRLFLTLVAIVYLPQKHCIPLTVYSAWQDMVKLLFVLVGMGTICMFVMKKMVITMKLNECLKLGEED